MAVQISEMGFDLSTNQLWLVSCGGEGTYLVEDITDDVAESSICALFNTGMVDLSGFNAFLE